MMFIIDDAYAHNDCPELGWVEAPAEEAERGGDRPRLRDQEGRRPGAGERGEEEIVSNHQIGGDGDEVVDVGDRRHVEEIVSWKS